MVAFCVRSDLRNTLRSPASETAWRTWKRPARASVPLVFSRSGSRSRKRASRVRTASRAGEQGCANPPDSIKMRDPSSPKMAALSSLVQLPYLVSSPALARHPSAHLLIIRHPALAVLLRTAVARRGDALSYQATQQSCPFTGTCVCSAVGTSARRGAPQQAEPRPASLAYAAAERHGAAHSRAVARPACPSRSPYAQPLCPRCWAELWTALGR